MATESHSAESHTVHCDGICNGSIMIRLMGAITDEVHERVQPAFMQFAVALGWTMVRSEDGSRRRLCPVCSKGY